MDTSAETVSLARIYAGWEDDQRQMIASIRRLTDAELALRAAPHLRTIGHLAAHIVAARARMVHWILGEGDSGLDALAAWDGFDQPAPAAIHPAAELALGLEATGDVIQRSLNRWTLADLEHSVEWRYGDEVLRYSRQRLLWNLVRHDYHHYGELALTLGMYGLPVPDF
jgi:uncharacterized damage-inducible protein DinB